ncbi:MAG: hypothetical protein ACOYXY_20595 [Thermodesulfobacteriota bacterium]
MQQTPTSPFPFSFKLWVPILVYAIVGLTGIVHHEMWRDELEHWLLARDSTELIDLVRNLRQEGHPAAWHLILFGVSRLTQNPLAMQLLHLGIAVCSAFFFLRYAPFPYLYRLLFCFGYFMSYEYAIISRAYGLAALCCWTYCAYYPHRYRSLIFLAFVLAVLVNTSVYGAILAVICLSVFLIDGAFLHRDELRRLPLLRIVLSACIFTASLAFALRSMVPDVDPVPWHFSLSIDRVGIALSGLWKAYFPVPDLFRIEFWNSNIVPHQALRAVLGGVLLVLGCLYFARKPMVLFAYVAGSCGLLLFSYTVYVGYLRHHGHLFVLATMCLWLSTYYQPIQVSCRILDRVLDFSASLGKVVIGIILVAQVVAGVYALAMEFKHDFSAAKRATELVKAKAAKGDVIAVLPNYFHSAPGYLYEPVFFPIANRIGTFGIYDDRFYSEADCSTLIQRLDIEMWRQGAKKLWLISNEPFNCRTSLLSIQQIAAFERTIEKKERAYVYQVTRP